VARARGNDLKRHIVVVSANFTLCHLTILTLNKQLTKDWAVYE
jgi:hypothetical protein